MQATGKIILYLNNDIKRDIMKIINFNLDHNKNVFRDISNLF
jgi:hypothetical protein